MKHFHGFCEKYNVLTPFPVSENLLCSFAAYLADQGLAPQTGKLYMSAVRNMQISLGLPDPREQSSLPMLKRVQAGIARARMLNGTPSRVRLPITAHVLGRIREVLISSQHPERVLLWAISCTAFFGFFRLGELLVDSLEAFNPATGLAWGDVAVDSESNPTMIRIHLKKSKCDQLGAGVDIIVGRTGSDLCPVAALLKYIALRQDRPGPFFLRSSREVTTKGWFVGQLRVILSAAGLPQLDYAGHSFHIGAATAAALAGVEDSTIQTLGRWHSSAFLQYIRMPREQLASISLVMARSHQPPVATQP